MESSHRFLGSWLRSVSLAASLLIPVGLLSAFQQGSPTSSREASIPGSAREEIAALAEEHYRLGLAYLGSPESTEKAVAHLERAAELDRANAEYHFALAEAYVKDFSFANIFRKPFIAARVRTQLELAVQYDPSSVRYREELIQYYVVAPALFGGSSGKARDHANALGRYDPYFGLLAHANISAEGGEHKKAVAEYQRAIAMRPEEWQGYQRWGMYCLNTRDYDRAVTQFRKCVELVPNVPENHESLADAYVHKRMYNQAIDSYLKALSLDKNRLPLLFRVAQLYEFMGLSGNAIRYYESYLGMSPTGRLANDARLRIADLRLR